MVFFFSFTCTSCYPLWSLRSFHESEEKTKMVGISYSHFLKVLKESIKPTLRRYKIKGHILFVKESNKPY